VAVSDLGGLGAKEGSPVSYDWTLLNPLPALLPWLAILLLLLLKPNRCAQAWWIGVPLACVAGAACVPQLAPNLLPSSQFEVLVELISALGFGLAALWLVSSYLAWKHRLLTFLGMLLTQAGFSMLAFAIRHGWEEDIWLETLQLGIFLAVIVLVISVAVSLAGLVCRGRYGWLRLSLWLIAALAVIWPLVCGPFYLISHVPAMVIFGVVGVAVMLTFGLLLPFLILSFANRFYRERLKGLLHLSREGRPPVIAPPVSVATAAAVS